MGKSKKKHSKIDFNQLLESDGTGGGWISGTSAMAVDVDEQPGPSPKAPGAAAMDTRDGPRHQLGQAAVRAPGNAHPLTGTGAAQKAAANAKRGARSQMQKKRKAARMDKAVARTEKTAMKLVSKQARSRSKLSLKSIY